MSELKLTEIERRIIEEQRRYPQASYISPCGIIEIMDTYIRELEAKAENGGDCENLRRENERLSSEVNGLRDALEDALNRRIVSGSVQDTLSQEAIRLRADLVAAQEQNLVLSNELRKAKDRAEAARLTEQQMMEWAVERILDYTGKTNYCVQFHVGGTMNVPPHGIRLNVVEVAAAILSGAKGDA